MNELQYSAEQSRPGMNTGGQADPTARSAERRDGRGGAAALDLTKGHISTNPRPATRSPFATTAADCAKSVGRLFRFAPPSNHRGVAYPINAT